MQRALSHLNERHAHVTTIDGDWHLLPALAFFTEVVRCNLTFLRLLERYGLARLPSKGLSVTVSAHPEEIPVIRGLTASDTFGLKVRCLEVITIATSVLEERILPQFSRNEGATQRYVLECKQAKLMAASIIMESQVDDPTLTWFWANLADQSELLLDEARGVPCEPDDIAYALELIARLRRAHGAMARADQCLDEALDLVAGVENIYRYLGLLIERLATARSVWRIGEVFADLEQEVTALVSVLSRADRMLLSSRFFGATDRSAARAARERPTLSCSVLDWAGFAVRGQHPLPPATPLLRLLMLEGSHALALLENRGHQTEVIELPELNESLIGEALRLWIGAPQARTKRREVRGHLRRAVRPLVERLTGLQGPVTVEGHGLLGWLPVHALPTDSGGPLCTLVDLSYRHPGPVTDAGGAFGKAAIDLAILDRSLPFWKSISSLLPTSAKRLLYDSGCDDLLIEPKEVLGSLSNSAGFLYYGHAHNDLDDAMESRLQLGAVSGVTVSDLSDLDLTRSKVGIVVGCATGQPNPYLGSPISIASSLALGGCQQVFATLWSVYPKVGFVFAKELLGQNESYYAAWRKMIENDSTRYAPFIVIDHGRLDSQ